MKIMSANHALKAVRKYTMAITISASVGIMLNII